MINIRAPKWCNNPEHRHPAGSPEGARYWPSLDPKYALCLCPKCNGRRVYPASDFEFTRQLELPLITPIERYARGLVIPEYEKQTKGGDKTMLINKKACRILLKEIDAQASKEFWVALDQKIRAIIIRAKRRSRNHRLTPITLVEV